MRRRAAVRFLVSVVGAGAAALLAARALPRRLEITTDIVGYPTYANFDPYPNFQRFYLTVLAFPALALVLHHLIGRWWRSDWPSPSEADPRDATTSPRAEVLARVLATGAAFGLGAALLGPGPSSWTWLIGGASAYAAVVLGAAWLHARHRWSGERFDGRAAALNALAAPLTAFVLLAASSATQVVSGPERAVHRYPWLGTGTVAGAAAVLLGATAIRLLRARSADGLRRIDAQWTTVIVLPVVTFVCAAQLPGPLADYDTFHFGEFLAGARLVADGAFPWRDLIFIHGLYQDVLVPWWGFERFGATVWGGLAGIGVLSRPLYWACMSSLYAYVLRRNLPLLLAALLVPLLGVPSIPHDRLAPLPVVLLAFAALLERATLPRALGLALALVVANVLVPELAYLVPACGIAVIGFELARYDRTASAVSNLRRTWMTFLGGLLFGGAWFAFLAGHGAGAGFVHYYTTFARGHELTGALPVARNLLHDPWYLVPMLLPPLTLVLQTWLVAASIRARRALEVRDWVMIALGIFVFAYYRKFLSRADMHVTHSAAPAVPLAWYLLDRLVHPATGLLRAPTVARWASRGVLAFVVLVAPVGGWGSLASIASRFRVVAPGAHPAPIVGWSVGGAAAGGDGDREIGTFLDAHLGPNDSLFDFTNQPARYHFALRRRSATRYYHVSMAIRRDTQLDLVRELERERPKLVVYESGDSMLAGWDGVSDAVRHYEVSRFLLAHYHPFARVRRELFLVRNDLAIPLRRTSPSVRPATGDDYRTGRSCDWGYAPAFVPHPALGEGPALRSRATSDATTEIDLAELSSAGSVAGLELDVGGGRGGALTIEEPPSDGRTSTQRAPLEIATFRVAPPPRPSDAFRVMLDDCPRWYDRRGSVLVVHHPPDLRIGGIRALLRDGARSNPSRSGAARAGAAAGVVGDAR